MLVENLSSEATVWAACGAAASKVINDDLDVAILELEHLLQADIDTVNGEAGFLLSLAHFHPTRPHQFWGLIA